MATSALAFTDCKCALVPVRCAEDLGGFLGACQDVETELHCSAVLTQTVANLVADRSNRNQGSSPKVGKCCKCKKKKMDISKENVIRPLGKEIL